MDVMCFVNIFTSWDQRARVTIMLLENVMDHNLREFKYFTSCGVWVIW